MCWRVLARLTTFTQIYNHHTRKFQIVGRSNIQSNGRLAMLNYEFNPPKYFPSLYLFFFFFLLLTIGNTLTGFNSWLHVTSATLSTNHVFSARAGYVFLPIKWRSPGISGRDSASPDSPCPRRPTYTMLPASVTYKRNGRCCIPYCSRTLSWLINFDIFCLLPFLNRFEGFGQKKKSEEQ